MRKRNSLFLVPILVLSSASLTGCSRKNTLLLLNWGEYINEDLVEAFEEKYDCIVKISIADSNELFYSKLKSGTTTYDLVIPSDYMVMKMKNADLLQEIDLSRLPHYDRSRFLPGVIGIEDEYINNLNFPEFERYQIPYLWGTFGLMYNKKVEGLEEALNTYGWDAYFDHSLMPKGTRSGMYSVARNSFAASMFHHKMSPNEVNDEALKIMQNDLANADFEQWGTDTLKKQIRDGALDVAYMYTGDFLDMFYSQINDEKDPKTIEEITYDIYIPEDTIAFMDSMVLTKNANNPDLAYKFMDFFLETENAMSNASVIGYCTPLQESYDNIVALKDSEDKGEQAWSYAMEKYYPILDPEIDGKSFQGTPLVGFDKNTLTKLNKIVYDVKTHK